MKILIIFILSTMALNSWACSARRVTLEYRVKTADLIFAGLVTGKELIDFEEINLDHVLNQPYKDIQDYGLSLSESPKYKVIPMQPLKGKVNKPLYVHAINPCHADLVNLKDDAVFIVNYENKKYNAFIINPDEKDLSEVLDRIKSLIKD